MTTELEQEFFKVFGIEAISKWHKCVDYSSVCCDKYDNCSKREFIYPEITDRKLLEMICSLNAICGVNCTAYESKNVEDLKEEILLECLQLQDEKNLQNEIQQLFKEEE